jgi:hypothetical protein
MLPVAHVGCWSHVAPEVKLSLMQMFVTADSRQYKAEVSNNRDKSLFT